MTNLPESAQPFVLPGARLDLSISDYEERPDIAPRTFLFTGNEAGFRSLSAVLTVVANELQDVVDLSTVPWIRADLGKHFYLRIEDAPQHPEQENGIVRELPDRFEWILTEAEVDCIAARLHGLGYAWNHLHFDPPAGASDYAVCCYLDDAV